MVKGITQSTLAAMVALALGAGAAHADETKKADKLVATAAPAHAAAGTDGTGTETTRVEKAAEEPASSWPIEIINRPLTLPKGAWSAGLGVSANNDFSVIGVDGTGLWGLSYGVTDALSLGVAYSLSAKPSSDGKGPLGINAAYTYFAGDKLTLTGTASTGYDFATEGMSGLSLGTYVWYNITPIITLISPGGQLSVGLEDPNELSFTLPVSVGYQFDKHVFATFDTNLLPNVGVKDSDTMVIGADTLPVGVTGYYSPSNQLDIGVSVSTDAKNSPGDNLAFGLLLLYYGGV